MTDSSVEKLGLTPKQLELRRTIIGGTDAPAILGIARYRSPFDVYAEKVGEAAPRGDMSPAALWGLILEPVIRARFELETGRTLHVPKRLLRRKGLPWQAGHLDGYDRQGIVEVKTARVSEGWGESGSDDIPPAYKAQVWHYLAVRGADRADVAVLIGGQDYRTYTIGWEPRIDELTAEEGAFRDNHIIPRVPPDWDGTPAATAWLRRRDPDDNGSELVAMPEQYGLLTDFATARHRKELWEHQEERLKQTIMDAMGPASKLLSPMLRITYARVRNTTVVNWEAYANHLAGLLRATGEPDDLIETTRGLYTQFKPGTRRFVVKVPQLEIT